MNELNLRPAQAKILRYQSGCMAVSAVPGSGKTFTLSRLAAQLIADGRVQSHPPDNQQVLIVTYLNASAESFKDKLRKELKALGLLPLGFDARTLHSLALEIVRLAEGDTLNGPIPIDDGQSQHFLSRAIDFWREDNQVFWNNSLPEDTPQMRVRWREIIEKTARVFIRSAKNERYNPSDILAQIATQDTPTKWEFTRMFAEIYQRYQMILTRQGALDYDDQVWLAVNHVENYPTLAEQLRQRWPYILEDEAQDSVPLQAVLLRKLIGDEGNLVRVGDPNQAITSTFTAAHPRFFKQFLAEDGVAKCPLPNSGRNAPMIFSVANRLVDWVCEAHPVLEVRENTFLQQAIEPTPPDDTQQNPLDEARKNNVRIQVYQHREEQEIPDVITLAQRYLTRYPERTVAILVPTNHLGHLVAEALDTLKLEYDSLLRGGTRERQIAAALHAVLALLANPLHKKSLRDAFDALRELEHPAANDILENMDRFHALLLSVHRPEALLYPEDENDLYMALPSGIATPEDVTQLVKFTTFLRRIFLLRPLSIDALALALGDELFAHKSAEFREGDLAIAYQLAHLLQGWQDMEPDKRLPDLVVELGDVAHGRRRVSFATQNQDGFEPRKGRITLATQHSAKGLEWDAVFLIGIDGYWIPWSLDAYFQGVYDFIGGDPTAQAAAELHHLMSGDARGYKDRSPTEAAHIDIISERLRLFYVGITRAKRFLQISRSRTVTNYGKERPSEGTQVMGVLNEFIHEYKGKGRG